MIAGKHVHCFLNSSDGVARWALDIGGKRSSLSSVDLALKAEGLVETISVVFGSLLKREGVSVSDIDQATFILGPGSFTSLRTSYAFLRGLIASNGIKLLGISSFLAFILGSKSNELGSVKLSLRANIQENFVADFILNSESSISGAAPYAIAMEQSASSEYIKLDALLNTDLLIEASHRIPQLDKKSLESLTEVGHLYMGSGPCELLYIKGVSAKTLLERGIS